MTPFAIMLLLLTILLLGMMVHDRILRSTGRQPGNVFNGLLFLTVVTAMTAHGWTYYGWQWCSLFFLVTLLIPYLAEALGIRFGIVFGNYEYADKIGPKGPGGVPIAVAGIWPAVLYVATLESFLLLQLLHPNTQPPNWLIAIIAATIATLSDVIIEPIMVDNGYWKWSPNQSLSGWRWGTIPLINFVSWFLTSWLAVFAALSLAGNAPAWQDNHDKWLLALPLVWIGLASWYTIGEAKRIHRTGIARLCFGLALAACAIFMILATH